MSDAVPGGRFARDTAVRPSAAGYDAEIVGGWDIGGNANGGYLLATLARALRDTGDKPDVVTISANYLAPGQPGPVAIAPRILKAGRTFTTVTGALTRDDAALVYATGTFGDLSGRESTIEQLDEGPPEIPDPDDCIRVTGTSGFPPPIMDNIDLRLHPDDVHFMAGKPHGRAQMRGWFRLLDDEAVDTIAVLLAVDAFPPTAFNAALPVAWVPTVELTVHVRARPEPGFLRCAFTTTYVSGGFLEEDGVVWDSAGRLIAQSRQLALLPRRSGL